MKIAILGAGATGLTAAYYLTKENHDVTIYEREDFVGGHASTFDIDGFPLEKGYHHWFTSDIDIIELCKEIGLGETINWFPSTVGTLSGGKIFKFSSPIDLLKYTPLSPFNRIRLGLSSLRIRFIKNWSEVENITAVDWLQKNAGPQAFKAFWEPMLRGKFGENHYQEVGMAWVWGKMNTRFASRKGISKEMLGYPSGSFKEVFETLLNKTISQGANIVMSTPVNKIKVSSNNVEGIEVGKDNSFKKYDVVIATTPSQVFNRITEGLSEDYRKKLATVSYMSAVLIILVLDRPLSNIYWLNIADRDVPFVGVIEHTNLVGTQNYGGKHIVYLSNYLTIDNAMYQMSEQKLLENYLSHLTKINPNFEESWILDKYHFKIDGAQPIIGKNYSSSIPPHSTGISNLYLANTTQIYPEDRGTNYSVKMGREVADIAIKNFA